MTAATRARGILVSMAVLAVAATWSSAWGVILLPGGSASLAGSTYNATPVDEIDRTITLTDGTNVYGDVTIRSMVTRNDDGTLNFEYRLINTLSSDLPLIADVRIYAFRDYQTDVDFNSDSTGGSWPVLANRDVNTVDIGFEQWLDTTLPPGEMTKRLTVRTNATDYEICGRLSLRVSIDGEMTFGSAEAFSPVVIPEPATIGLVALAGVTLLVRARRSSSVWELARRRHNNNGRG